MNMDEFNKMSFLHEAQWKEETGEEVKVFFFEDRDKIFMVDVEGQRYRESLSPGDSSSKHYSEWYPFT